MITLDFIELILEIVLGICFLDAYIKNNKDKIIKYGFAEALVLLSHICANTYQR